jgi:hypothetical protein
MDQTNSNSKFTVHKSPVLPTASLNSAALQTPSVPACGAMRAVICGHKLMRWAGNATFRAGNEDQQKILHMKANLLIFSSATGGGLEAAGAD